MVNHMAVVLPGMPQTGISTLQTKDRSRQWQPAELPIEYREDRVPGKDEGRARTLIQRIIGRKTVIGR
jgi:hypothetical protein